MYVDNIIFTRYDTAKKRRLKEQLANKLEIKDLGRLKYFLGFEVAYSKQGIFLS